MNLKAELHITESETVAHSENFVVVEEEIEHSHVVYEVKAESHKELAERVKSIVETLDV